MSDVSLAPFALPPGVHPSTLKGFTKYDAPLLTEYDRTASVTLGYDVWRVTEAFAFYVGKLEDDTWVYIPAGYLTDGASVPRFLWDLLPPWGSYGQAAVVHDMLCEYLTVFKKGIPTRICRQDADDILLEAMTALGVRPIKKYAIYAGVKFYTYCTHHYQPRAYAQKRALEDGWKPDAGAPVTAMPEVSPA